MLELSDDEAFKFDPDLANSMLADAGYLDTDGDGVREMPDGTDPLDFRYIERSESETVRDLGSSSPQWLADIGIGTQVEVMDDNQSTRRASRARSTSSSGVGRRSSTPT